MRNVHNMATLPTARLGRRLDGPDLCVFQFIYDSPKQTRLPNSAGQVYYFKMSTFRCLFKDI